MSEKNYWDWFAMKTSKSFRMADVVKVENDQHEHGFHLQKSLLSTQLPTVFIGAVANWVSQAVRSYGFAERHVTGPMKPKRIRRLDSIEDLIKLGLNPGMVIQDRTCLLFVRGLEEVSAKSGNLTASDPAPAAVLYET